MEENNKNDDRFMTIFNWIVAISVILSMVFSFLDKNYKLLLWQTVTLIWIFNYLSMNGTINKLQRLLDDSIALAKSLFKQRDQLLAENHDLVLRVEELNKKINP